MYSIASKSLLTTYGDTVVSLSDEVKKSDRLFYLKLYGNFDGNLNEARAHAFRTTTENFTTTSCVHSSKFSFAKLLSRITSNIPAPTSFGRES